MAGGRFDAGRHIREKQIGSAAIGTQQRLRKKLCCKDLCGSEVGGV
jgi:hypothetical protein